MDQLILTSPESVWNIHGSHDHNEEHDHDEEQRPRRRT